MPRRSGLTIVELLVAIAIIGVLVGLLLPAVMAAREAAQGVQCRNHLKQIGLACLAHEAAHGHLPTGGWGFAWVGDPDRGFEMRQPGGWIYNVLPFLEQQVLRELGRGRQPSEKKQHATLCMQQPLPVFACPSRRVAAISWFDTSRNLINANYVPAVAKSDYAINAGDIDPGGGEGPSNPADGDRPSYGWRDFSTASGVCYLRSTVRLADVLDGTSNTYLAGEKYVSRNSKDIGDDQSMYAGYDYDSYRWAKPSSPPLRDSHGSAPDRFGARHRGDCGFVLADGSVRSISYAIDPVVHRNMGNRHDGHVGAKSEDL